MKDMLAVYQDIDVGLHHAAKRIIKARGIPTTVDAADLIAGDLYAELLDTRKYLASRESAMIREYAPSMVIPPDPPYKLTSLQKMVRRQAGLTPISSLASVELLDPISREISSVSIRPWTMPENEEVQEEFLRRISAGMARHAKSASRDLVIDTARANNALWARQLSGAENCAFCAMLVSRGAVYSKNTARFQTHNHCDCTATIVTSPRADYPGREEARLLAGLYRRSRRNPETGELAKSSQEQVKFFGIQYRQLAENEGSENGKVSA